MHKPINNNISEKWDLGPRTLKGNPNEDPKVRT